MNPAILIIAGVFLLYLVISGRAAGVVRVLMTGKTGS